MRTTLIFGASAAVVTPRRAPEMRKTALVNSSAAYRSGLAAFSGTVTVQADTPPLKSGWASPLPSAPRTSSDERFPPQTAAADKTAPAATSTRNNSVSRDFMLITFI